MRIWFDMDGTIADLYGVDGWLSDIIANNTRPYEIARGLGNIAYIARLLNKVRENGHTIGVISWTARGGSDDYNARIKAAKREWLQRHFPSVTWDEIRVVAYGTNKKTATGGGILFDDEEPNRTTWGDGAYAPADIPAVLKALTK
jgi:hypothetical protein